MEVNISRRYPSLKSISTSTEFSAFKKSLFRVPFLKDFPPENSRSPLYLHIGKHNTSLMLQSSHRRVKQSVIWASEIRIQYIQST